MTRACHAVQCVRPLVLSLTTLAAISTGVFAQQTGDITFPPSSFAAVQTGAAERLVAADRLRSASVSLTAHACHLRLGTAGQDSHGSIEHISKDIARSLRVLEYGPAIHRKQDTDLRRGTRVELAGFKSLWGDIRGAADRFLTSQDDDAAYSMILAGGEVLADRADVLFAYVHAEQANPAELILRDSIHVDIVGKQARLLQQISLQTCHIAAGDRSRKRIEAYRTKIWSVERGLRALIEGLPQMGIQPAPTPEIRAKLMDLQGNWSLSRSFLDAIAERDMPQLTYRHLHRSLNAHHLAMRQIVDLYAEHSRHLY